VSRAVRASWLLGAFLIWTEQGFGYNGSEHQHLTFLAAKQFNRCVEGTDIPPLTPLQVRYMARANAGLAERSVFARMFNWRYYDRADQSEQNVLWLVDTRFHDHFNELTERVADVEHSIEAYQDLGRILSYVQLVSSPAHTVPVYTARFWRFSFNDRFDGFPVDHQALASAIEGDCGFLDTPADSYQDILAGVASATLNGVKAPIPGMPVAWTAFWKPDDDPGAFGDYGAAGNSFGRRTEFRCGDGQRCVLLKDDPLYLEFARDRHLDALQGTLAALLLMQSTGRETMATLQ
jgi:hypothetical protein